MPRGNGEMVLVVDDEASILTITSQTLQAFGYRVLTATDGADAVAVYAQHTKEMNKGTGLGLSTVMAIVKSHEGIVNVYSEPGNGTTFKVYLPALDISDDPRKERVEEVSLPRGKGETVLVVDDESSIVVITSQTLQAFGYRVLTAMDGADALATYLQNRETIAVVLTDMAMPVMDGPAMIHALKRINPRVKIIAASGLNATGGPVRETVDGVRHFLKKPYTAGTLLKVLRTILDET